MQTTSAHAGHRQCSWPAVIGALCAAAAVALTAYAAHGYHGIALSRLNTVASFAFGHGAAGAALAPSATRTMDNIALALLCTGVLLFSGSLVFNVIAGWPIHLAPFGGMLLIAGWVVWAVGALRRR